MNKSGRNNSNVFINGKELSIVRKSFDNYAVFKHQATFGANNLGDTQLLLLVNNSGKKEGAQDEA